MGLKYLLSEGYIFGERHRGVVILFVVTHPNFCGSPRVPGKDIARAPRERVWMLLTKDVTHAAAWDDFQGAAALPDAERYF